MKCKRDIVFALMLLLITGCFSSASKRAFDYDGMPKDRYVVGGGYEIQYRAGADGDLFIADTHAKKLLATISLERGQMHTFDCGIRDQQTLEFMRAMGVDSSNAIIRVYFVERHFE